MNGESFRFEFTTKLILIATRRRRLPIEVAFTYDIMHFFQDNVSDLANFFEKQDNVQANLESVQCRVFQICKVFDYQYCKSRSRDPFPTPFDLIFHFYR